MNISVKEAAEYLQNKSIRKNDLCKSLYKKASADAKAMILHIINHYPGVKIYQWGSLLSPDHFDELSDIDIGVEGISSLEMFFKLYKELDDMTDFSLDLVELDKTDSLSRKSILERGRRIYNG